MHSLNPFADLHSLIYQILGFSATYHTLVNEISRLLCQHFKIKEAFQYVEQRWPNGQTDMQLSGSMWVDWKNGKATRVTARTFQEVMIAFRANPDLAIKARCTLMQDGRVEDDIVEANKSVARWKRAEIQRATAQRKEMEKADRAEEEQRRAYSAEMQRKQAEAKRKEEEVKRKEEEAAKPSLAVRSKKSVAELRKKTSRMLRKSGEAWFSGFK